MKQNKPLSFMIQEAKNNTFAAFGRIQKESGLPAFLFEGILTDLLAQVREQKNLELSKDLERMSQESEKKEPEGNKND